MNIQAFSDFARAGDAYLEKNDWEKVAPGKWKVPKQFGIYAGDVYLQWRAVVAQYDYDSEKLR